MQVTDFDYNLPKELIAQTPTKDRSQCRLLGLNRQNGKVTHDTFTNISQYLKPGDCLVLNDTRVLPARLLGKRTDSDGVIEFLLLNQRENGCWEVMVRPGKRAKIGRSFTFGNGELIGQVDSILENGNRLVHFTYNGNFFEILDRVGIMPLPPYIKEKLKENERYQTVYSKILGSAAAPTAGLHFTREILEDLKKIGIEIVYLTLHVGIGTFRPVKVDQVEEHKMHAEFYSVSKESADKINAAKRAGGRIICVGTTSCRTLESVADEQGNIPAKTGWTDIFIFPGYQFKVMDGLITNFHLPKSTLIMLVSAFGGKENVFKAYEEAILEQYRFFSFGDAMIIY